MKLYRKLEIPTWKNLLKFKIYRIGSTIRYVNTVFLDYNHPELCSVVHTLLSSGQQERETEHLQNELTERELELQGVKEDLVKLTHDSIGRSRQKRGLLVNIKESISSPSSGNLCRTIRKSVRTTASLRKKPNWSSVLYVWLSRCWLFLLWWLFNLIKHFSPTHSGSKILMAQSFI